MPDIMRRMLGTARARDRARIVQWMLPTVRGGNIMYYWQWAWLQRQKGARAAILRTDHMAAWIEEFPLVGRLTVSPGPQRLLDRRGQATQHGFGRNFSREENRDFCRALIAASPTFQRRLDRARDFCGDSLVVNVRRGDYYAVPEFRTRFALDICEHVRQGFELAARSGRRTTDVVVVSDDLAWCAQNLSGLLPSGWRTFTERESMFDDLAMLASSRTLILANSTFSYWGSFLASAQHPGHLAIAPAYHERIEDGALDDSMLDPQWPRTRTAFPQ